MTEESDVVDVKEEPLPLWRRVLSMLVIAGLVLMVGSMAASYLLRWQLGREISKAAGIGEPMSFSEMAKDSGEVADSLGELVPDYIGAVGIDPYTGKQLRYVHDDTGYTVYGIGENRIDDGGKTKSLAKGVKPLDLGVNIRFRE